MRKTFFFAFLLLPFAFLPSFGQTGGVKGKVKNMNGDGIANATITARQNSEDVVSTRSGNKGTFVLNGLKDGTYNIVFDAKGYATGVKFRVEVKNGKILDLGGNLILMTDRGSQTLVQGSVFYKDGTSLPGAKVEVERVEPNGSYRKIGTYWTNEIGEFSFRQSQEAQKFRITASHRGVSATKEIDVESANVFRTAIKLELNRGENQ